ncbi:DUF4430 domain-containing protein [Lactobacillus helveticus]|uniref:DUF4430 domain-containing protein n=1 Tax=Lactobacillus helveticus TaxID=1587 RepID=UPI001C6531CB|nr:DUF4430 domain-containing protein [Lactobacillus helveticus]MBW8009451.1 DUF4430 domain-containing protein [Lactobacillus helveticus]MBW8013984.1 DUF4430 domain-containing protein [Lactobacillus helveticus]MBW8019462.1 DUF4430 domain-containing protein [Lactobacillus helveticus]MBW8044121.1 DUF4430 domain-containing protein [Lactobacillus helveticus]MBW8053556.1 DUF4430 domain-containing protein [Lactobacillus helveticus]
MKKQNRFSLIFAIIAFFTLALTGCSNNNAAPKKANSNQISVNYTLKEGKKTVDSKTVKVPKKSKVITGLKKAWKVQETKGFITAIDGKKQNPKKKIYWTYTINEKWATKGVTQQKVANKDKVKFTLDKVK